MPARKRVQGQARHFRKYLQNQTGTNDPRALTQRCEQLETGLETVRADLAKLHEREADGLGPDALGPEPPTSDEAVHREWSNRRAVVEMREEQKRHLKKMLADLTEMHAVNRRLRDRFGK